MFLIAHLECVDEIFFGFNHVWNTHDLGDGTRWYDETTQADLINKERHNRNSLVRVEQGKSDKYVTIMLSLSHYKSYETQVQVWRLLLARTRT